MILSNRPSRALLRAMPSALKPALKICRKLCRKACRNPCSNPYSLMISVLLCLMPALGHSAAAETEITLEPPLRIALEPSPHAYRDKEGRVHGLIPELLEGIAVHMPRRVDFSFMPYLRGLHELEQGRIDMMYAFDIGDSGIHLPPHIIRAERPEAIMPLSLYAKSGSDVSINSKADMQSYKAGFLRMAATSERTWDAEQGKAFYFSSIEALLKALLMGHVDVAALGPSAAWVVKAKFGEELDRVYEYSFLHMYPVFSAKLQEGRDAGAGLCQQYLTARSKAVAQGLYARVIQAKLVDFMLPYFEQAGGFLPGPDRCIVSTPVEH